MLQVQGKKRHYFSLMIWIVALVLIGSLIGSLTKMEIDTWYNTIERSQLTPPDYVFPVVWSILYTLIAICGWMIWSLPAKDKVNRIKIVYVLHLICNWSWTPLFFGYHLTLYALLDLIIMDALVISLIFLCYRVVRPVSILMLPYLLWIFFASYLNYYIFINN